MTRRLPTSPTAFNPSAPPGGKAPNDGSQPSLSENTATKSMPTQNAGIASTNSIPAMTLLSLGRPRFHAAMAPSAVPATTLITAAGRARSKVHPTRSASNPLTGFPYRMELPRSAVAIPRR